jgi:hypothetical protein
MGLKRAKQFESILFVLDERGFITSFAIGRTKSLGHFKDTLREISLRAPNLKVILTGMKDCLTYMHLCTISQFAFIFPDNCCADRGVLQDVFGTHVEIKLDPFHSIQRVTMAVKKKDMNISDRRAFFVDVRNVIRKPEDHLMPRRTSNTPGKIHFN